MRTTTSTSSFFGELGRTLYLLMLIIPFASFHFMFIFGISNSLVFADLKSDREQADEELRREMKQTVWSRFLWNHDKDVSMDVIVLNRHKRNIFQLGESFIKNTKYSPIKLANYGNWCGIGGDRHNDGSVVDLCDLCCKKHDKCYHRARTKYPGCSPRFVTYLIGDTSDHGGSQCNDSPSCALEVCRCDTKFVNCMKKEPCSPLKVYEDVSYFWWLMPSKKST